MQNELRKHRRLSVKWQTFAGLIGEESNDTFYQLGQILDISESGMSLYYVPRDKDEDVVSHVSIYGKTDRFIEVEKIPCKIVYNICVPAKERSNLPEARCGIEFLDRSPSQDNQLRSFINDFAIHPYSERPG